jgi:formylglycine-generating enzyme required for sulfatase activity
MAPQDQSSADHEKPEAKKDPLGYDVYAQTLWARIQTALSKDQGPDAHGNPKPLGDDPLVVGIFGEWGAGKSHLLKLMEALAQKHQAQQRQVRERDDGFELTVPVFFQSWKYEHEEHLHVPLLMHVIGALKDALKKEDGLLQALQRLPSQVEQKAQTLTTTVQKTARIAGYTYRAAQMLVGSVSAFGAKVDLPDEPLTWLKQVADGSSQASDKLKEREDAREKKAAKHKAKSPQYTADSLYFYRINELLKKLTRPGKDEWVKEEVDSDHLLENTRINFVIFIDDLDRCLPEKAVQTLELIKTVFNVESFAFVLALDDEVIERGIGHRYKDYELQDKKPKMPITGFEYLEKIVHLPFRLPALTSAQANVFIAHTESSIQSAPLAESLESKAKTDARLFFRYGRPAPGTPEALRSNDIAERPTLYTALLLKSFDHYVPRKLVRAIELAYQVERVANQRGKGWNLSRDLRRTGGDKQLAQPSEADNIAAASSNTPFHAVMFGLLLLQLFQPEVFRVVRRKEACLGSLLGAFVGAAPQWADHTQVSEVALWQWAVSYQAERLGEKLQNSQVPHNWASSVAYLAAIKLEPGERYTAQQVRLPLVQRLTEHMQIERHAFNPFRWASALAGLLGEGVRDLKISDYLEYLSEGQPHESAPVDSFVSPSQVRASAEQTRQEFALPPTSLQAIYDRLTSQDLGVQGELRALLEPYAGQVLDRASANNLFSKLNKAAVDKVQLLRGLNDLAPYIDPERDGAQFWNLVKDCGIAIPNPAIANEVTSDPKAASLYLDVQSMLGQDPRFEKPSPENPGTQNANCLHLLKAPWEGWQDEEHAKQREPIAGFVRFEGGKFNAGHPKEGNNRDPKTNGPFQADAGPPFYMARMLTTVDQYAQFVNAGGYTDPKCLEKHWDLQGRLWITSQDRALQEPWGWAEQKRVGSRAVHGITWFEARAYASWLNEQLHDRLQNLPLPKEAPKGACYKVRLPNELQWEYAARAGAADNRRLPWGDDEPSASHRANIVPSGIGHASVPGVFAPNTAGLLDMAGNLWEWQDGLCRKAQADAKKPKHQSDELKSIKREQLNLLKDTSQVLTNDWNTSDHVARRGGSWIVLPEYAACSYRDGYQADFWLNDVGFRVMLSLADSAT